MPGPFHENPVFDLEAYFARIGYAGPRPPSLVSLQEIQLRHTRTMPFENLDPLLGRPVHLDAAALQRKMIAGGRGGYCFEQNSLLRFALEAMGFEVRGLAARVLWNVSAGVVMPRTHMLLQTIIEGEPWLVDAGFGGPTPTAPLRLVADAAQETPHERYRLTESDGNFVLHIEVGGTWRPLYGFDMAECLDVDYKVGNWFTAGHPDSPFVNRLVAARAGEGARYGLLNNELTIRRMAGETERRALRDASAIRTVLEEVFGLKLSAVSGLDPVLERLIGVGRC